MPEHLNRVEISLLLEHPEDVPGGPEHLTGCPECAHEYEQMSRMRMALSGLPELEPPVGEWDAVQERLGLEPLRQAIGTPRWWQTARRPLQVAAVISLFAAGLMVGRRDAGRSDSADPSALTTAAVPVDARDPGAPAESSLAIEPAEAYLRTVADLQQLRDSFDESAWRQPGPEAFAERITHLDAMIDASRDALREAPEDPVLNNFLFQLVDEREDLAGQLDQTLRMTAAEY